MYINHTWYPLRQICLHKQAKAGNRPVLRVILIAAGVLLCRADHLQMMSGLCLHDCQRFWIYVHVSDQAVAMWPE